MEESQHGLDRACFICLAGVGEADHDPNALIPCCNRCYAVAHGTCWKDWRRSQANYARRTRSAGGHLTMDPFICSICKSGYARMEGECASLRWLESFASFFGYNTYNVRTSSGIFSALAGVRGESAPPNTADIESDFLEFFEHEQSVSFLSRIGINQDGFTLAQTLLISFIVLGLLVVDLVGLANRSNALFAATQIFLVYTVLVAVYIFLNYQRIVSSERLYN